MKPAQVAVKLVLDAIDQTLELGEFEERLSIQKKVYLTQLTGLDLGYRFSWYLYGPYCRELTADAFALKQLIDRGDREFCSKALTQAVSERIQRARAIWEPWPDGIDRDDWLELLASLHYLRHIAYWPRNQRPEFERVYSELISSKPRFKRRKHHARTAWQRLAELGLTKKKTL